jgi:hypothetical protein
VGRLGRTILSWTFLELEWDLGLVVVDALFALHLLFPCFSLVEKMVDEKGDRSSG